MASYYSGCKAGTLEHHFVGTMNLNICVTEDYSDVHVSMEVSDTVHSFDGEFSWTMYLQRKVNHTWTNVASRTGYINPDSPSNRTFTNVGQPNEETRIKVVFKTADVANQTRYSPMFLR